MVIERLTLRGFGQFGAEGAPRDVHFAPGLNLIVGPNEAAIVVRDGQVTEILSEARIEAADVLDQLASLFRLGADISVFFVDTGPIDLAIFLGETEKRAASTNHLCAKARSKCLHSSFSTQSADMCRSHQLS